MLNFGIQQDIFQAGQITVSNTTKVSCQWLRAMVVNDLLKKIPNHPQNHISWQCVSPLISKPAAFVRAL